MNNKTWVLEQISATDKIKTIWSEISGSGICKFPDSVLAWLDLSDTQKRDIAEKTSYAPGYIRLFADFSELCNGMTSQDAAEMIKVLTEETRRSYVWSWIRNYTMWLVINYLKDDKYEEAKELLRVMNREETDKILLLLGSSPTDEPAAATVAEWAASTDRILTAPEGLS